MIPIYISPVRLFQTAATYLFLLIFLGFTNVFGQISLVKDIQSGTGDGLSYSSYFIPAGSVSYFIGYTSSAGNELWKTDGTGSGTVLVKDIYPGASGSNIRNMFMVGSILYFVADNGTNGSELWRSDGTGAGTYLVKDIYAGTSSGINTYTFFATIGTTFYFTADGGTTGYELWKSDGTSGGTTLVKDIYTGTTSAFQGWVNYATVLGSNLYFTATNSTNGQELWVSDGTAGGTVLLKDIYPGTNSSSIELLTTLGSKIYFRAYNGTNGTEPWVSDGSAGGTVLLKDIYSGATSSSPSEFIIYGSQVLFKANDATNGYELWKTDGTTGGTSLVKDINAGTSSGDPTGFFVFGSNVYFNAYTSTQGTELWRTDGTSGGTVIVKDIQTGTGSSSPSTRVAGGTVFYFSAYNSTNGTELWKSDGTTGGTVMVRDISTGTVGSNPTNLAYLNGTLYFSADYVHPYGSLGSEPYKSDGTSAGTLMLDNMINGSSNPRSFIFLNSHVLFAGTKSTTGTELYEVTTGHHKYPYFKAQDTVLYINSPFNKTNFYDYSPNDPTAWSWTFTGGTPSSSTTQHPTNVTYNAVGCYPVTLSATYPGGAVPATKTCYITVQDINSVYCTSAGSGTTGYFYVNGVSLGSINNQGTGSSTGTNYTYYSSMSTTVNQQQTYTITIDGRGGSSASYAAFIDYNRDGDFDDPDESLGCEFGWINGNDVRTITFTVPAGTYIGQTRLRVRAAEGVVSSTWVYLDPCGDGGGQDGETEDYKINIAGGLPPVANFSANSTTINSGQTVNFTDLSTNLPTGWSWSFTGGSPATSTAQNPSNILYSTPGCYQVTLTATNAYGSDPEVKTCYINVLNQALAPVADFSASATTVVAGSPISFTDLSTNNPTTWSWNFSGASPSSSTTQNPTNIIYSTAGTYTVSMTASNANGSNTKTKTNYITVVEYCKPYTPGQTTGGNYIDDVILASLPNSGIKIYNANSGSTSGPTYRDYTSTIGYVKRDSTYRIGVEVSTAGGDAVVWIDFNHDGDFVDAGEKVGEFQSTGGSFGNYDTFDFTVPSTAPLGNTRMRVRFYAPFGAGLQPCVNSNSGEIEDYTINIGQQVTCSAAPVANFTPASSTIAPGGTVNFTSTSTNNPTTYSWTFTGGTPATSTVANPTGISFTTAGCHQVSLTATNACGTNTKTVPCAVNVTSGGPSYCAITTSQYGTSDGDYIDGVQLGTINNQNTGSPTGAFYNNYTSMSTNLTRSTAYTLSIKAGPWAASYPDYYAAWIDYNQDGDFVDANEKLGEYLSTVSGGVQTISFTVPASASLGSTRMRIRGVWVTAGPVDPCAAYNYGETEDYSVNIQSAGAAPVANFTSNVTSISPGGSVNFSDLSTNSPTSWSWSFTGGTPATSSAQNPSGVTFTTAGCHQVSLTATNSYGSDPEVKTCYINVGSASSSCDTLRNYLTSHAPIVYTNTGGGYLAGHNSYGDLAKADKFSGYTPGNKINGAYLKFARAKYSTTAKTISVKVWDASGAGGTPNTVLATKTVTIASIATNVNAGAWTYVTFASPVSVTGPFYLGIEFAYASGDTVALATNTDGQTTPGTGWEKWSDGTWHAYSDATSWGIDIAHFIAPVLCPTVTAQIEAMESEYLSVYPNPTDGQFTFVKEGRAKELDILIVDALGQKVFERHLEAGDGKFNESIDLTAKSSGIYFLKILSDGEETVKRIVISK